MSENKFQNAAPKERATRLPRDERRRQLTECAVRVFARFGIGNAGHAQVADEAGVSTPTVFLYMPNRQALIDCVLAEVDRYLTDMVNRAADSTHTAAEKLLAVTHAFAAAIDSDPDHVKVFLNWGAVVHEATWPQYIDFQDRILATFEDIIVQGVREGDLRDAVNPMWGAHLVLGSANMIAQMKFRSRDQAEISGFLSALIRGALSQRD